jgi:tRNA pseudouridine55 synthase
MEFILRRSSIISTGSEKRKRIPIDGVLVVDKPEGITSLDVVREIKRRCSVKRAGHIGTLDPFATGVLPIVLNEGTKLVPFMEEDPKEYEAVLRLGEETNTDDPTGQVVAREPVNGITTEMVESALRTFQGKIQQIPPMFSAIKIEGKPLYRLARKGIEVERKGREVTIYDLGVQRISLPEIHFRVLCSRGTYIRTLAKDLGRTLGCGGHLLRLRRIRSGPFTLDQSVPWKIVCTSLGPEDFLPWLITLREALRDLPEVIGDESVVEKLRVGQGMAVRDLSAQELPDFGKGQWVKITSSRGGLVAILRSEVRRTDIERLPPDIVALRPLRVFHAQGAS